MNITKDIKKLSPWNWLKHEERESGHSFPIQRINLRSPLSYYGSNPFISLHQEMDRLFESVLQEFIGSNSQSSRSLALHPSVDISATDKDYTITIDIPGVTEDDVKLELKDDVLIISGKRKQETEEKNKNFYRVECSYGFFQRVLSLPEDADQDNV